MMMTNQSFVFGTRVDVDLLGGVNEVWRSKNIGFVFCFLVNDYILCLNR